MDTNEKADRLADRVNATAVEKQFVRKYKQLQHLWNQNHPDYNNRFKRNAGYDALLPIFRQYMPEATRFHVRQKINILRSIYRKERRKLLASSRLDEDGNLEYTYMPSLWKYHAMKFLDEGVDEETEHDETGTEFVDAEIEYLDTQVIESENEDTSKIEASPIYLDDNFDDDLEDQKPFKRKRKRNSTNNSYEDMFVYSEDNVLEKEFKAIGANVACKLQRMTTQQRYRAELLINKVLIQGLQENLTEAMDLSDMWHVTHEDSNYKNGNPSNKECSIDDSTNGLMDHIGDLNSEN